MKKEEQFIFIFSRLMRCNIQLMQCIGAYQFCNKESVHIGSLQVRQHKLIHLRFSFSRTCSSRIGPVSSVLYQGASQFFHRVHVFGKFTMTDIAQHGGNSASAETAVISTFFGFLLCTIYTCTYTPTTIHTIFRVAWDL